jgi:small subunit ribosomal protein S4e
MHLKRESVPKSWPITRKGTAYVVRPSSSLNEGIPVLVVLRDIMEVAQNRKEVKKIIHANQIMVNQRLVKDEKKSLSLFDTISLVPLKKSYRLTLTEKGKFKLEEISEKEAGEKIAKIINKKVLNGKKVQLNLSDGRNILDNRKCKVNDSVVVNLKENKVEKVMEIKDKVKAMVMGGKHAGRSGQIENIDLDKKMALIETKDKEKINVLTKHIMAIN